MSTPKAPSRSEPASWEHYKLFRHVKEAIRAIPDYFSTPTTIEGIHTADLFTLNSALGAMIEDQVVATLNKLRPMWDAEDKYQAYSFIRQAQTFPDVLLRKSENGADILMGIELKGWYLLAKERMPNFRFVVSADACNEWDLIVVVPWVLSNVLSGTPVAHRPYIELAKYAAQQRNYYWKYERQTSTDNEITRAGGIKPYPAKGDHISDKPKSDSGNNFGRLARYDIMKPYVAAMLDLNVRGIPVKSWIKFFSENCSQSG